MKKQPLFLENAAFVGLWLFAGVALLSIAAQNVLFVGLAAWLGLAGATGNTSQLKPAKPLLWFLPFAALALAACFASDNAPHSLDSYKRWTLIVAAWYAAGAVTSPKRLLAILGALLFFSALWSLGASLWSLHYPLWQLAHGAERGSVLYQWTQDGSWRAHSGSGGYMILGTGSMLLLCFFTALALEDARFRRPLPLACLAALGLALLLTLTRSAWLGAALGCGGLLLLRRPRLAIVAVVLVLLLAVVPGSPVKARIDQGFDYRQNSTRERVFMAQAGLNIIQQHPLLGVGDAMESFDGHPGYYIQNLSNEGKEWFKLFNEDRGHLHNDLIQVAAMYGLPALALLLLFFGCVAWQVFPETKAENALARGVALGCLAALAAWWANGMLEYNFGSFQSCFTLWFLVGLALASSRIHRGRDLP